MALSKGIAETGIHRTVLNLLRNDLIKFDIAPLVYQTIIDWEFALPEGMKIIDHINDLKLVDKIKEKCNVNLIKWMRKHERKLKENSFSNFDITTLHDVLPILCYRRIAQTGSREYFEQLKDPDSVESLLKKIKYFRDGISHDYSKALDYSRVDEIRNTMRECIIAAGKLFCKDQIEIDEKVNALDNKFDKILLDTTHFYEDRVKYIAQKISTELPSKLLERYSPYFFVSLPGSFKKIDTFDIFQCSNLSVITEGENGGDNNHNKKVFPCTEIYNNTHEKFVVINGGPGSGKTTLMRHMYQDILETSVNDSTPRYRKSDRFKLPIYIECRSEQETNLARILRDYLYDFLSPEDDIYEAFKLVKGLVFFIDGYEEINDNSRKLVDSVIDFCRYYNASCIVSSSVDAGNNFVNKLQRLNLLYTKMFIEPISEMNNKLNFLRSYAGKMDDHIDTDKLVNSFENLTATAQEIFSSPFLLALFISLFIHDPDSVYQMKNEHSAYEAVRTNFLCEMVRKLKQENVSNPELRARQIANMLGKFCFKLLKQKKYLLDKEDYSEIIVECKKIMSADINIPNLLSCILLPEHSFEYNHDVSYKFLHITIQDFFAAKYVSENKIEIQDVRNSKCQVLSKFFSDMKKAIVKKLKNPAKAFDGSKSPHSQPEDGELPKILQKLRLDELPRDNKRGMERLGNTIKFVMLKTLENQELPKYSNDFTLFIRECYGPKHSSTVYLLDLILSSDSNRDIIRIVSDCMRGWRRYNLKHSRHIEPMTEVLHTITSGVKVDFDCHEAVNTQQIVGLLTVLGDDSEIELKLRNSYSNCQPLEGELYTQLKNSKCKVTAFTACISSKEHLSIVVGVLRGIYSTLYITTPSATAYSFEALEEYNGVLDLRVKYTKKEVPSTGSNPVRERTFLRIDNITADDKDNLHNLLKYMSPESKEFSGIYLDYCDLADSDVNDLLKELQEEQIRTIEGDTTEVKEIWVHDDKSRRLEICLKDQKGREEEKRENEERGKRKIEEEKKKMEEEKRKMEEEKKKMEEEKKKMEEEKRKMEEEKKKMEEEKRKMEEEKKKMEEEERRVKEEYGRGK